MLLECQKVPDSRFNKADSNVANNLKIDHDKDIRYMHGPFDRFPK